MSDQTGQQLTAPRRVPAFHGGDRPAKSSPRARYTLTVLVLIYAMSFVDRNILYVVAPSVQAELNLNDTQLGLLSGLAFAIFYATMALPIARIAERRSRVKMMAGALVLWSVMTAVSGFATKFWQLFAARLCVGVGEGACTPCAQSIICDLYPPNKRATALSTYSVGVPVGVMVGGVGGAFAAELFGWRGAFIAAAIPGLLLALVLAITVREPRRGACETVEVTERPIPSFANVVRRLWKSPSFRHVTWGYAAAAVPGTAIQIFFIVFLVRVHGMNQLEAGVAYGIIAGVTGAIGMFFGGRITDYFGSRNIRAYGYVPAAAFLCLPGLLFAAFTRESLLAMTIIISIPATIYVFNIGASYAVTNNLVEPRMRATTNAILLMVVTFAGAGFGPALVGWLSDHIAAFHFGGDYRQLCLSANKGPAPLPACLAASAQGLRYALILTSLFYFWGAFHYFRLSQVIRDEMQPAD